VFDAELDFWDALAVEPRRYGFHAAPKAPFHLSSSCTGAQLVSALHSFAGLGHAIPALTPTVRMLSGLPRSERISLVRQNDADSSFRVVEQATLRTAR
jgi:hypothetical protein